MEEIRHKLIILRDTDHDWVKPTIARSIPIKANARGALKLSVI